MVEDHSDSERERNVLFNDALNTFYLWLYGVRHMVKDHSDNYFTDKEGKGERERERNVLFNNALNILFTIIWHHTYG